MCRNRLVSFLYADETKHKFEGFELDLNEVKKLNRPGGNFGK